MRAWAIVLLAAGLASVAVADAGAPEHPFWTFKFVTMKPAATRPMMAVERPLLALENDVGACGGYQAFALNVDLYIAPAGTVARTEIHPLPHQDDAPAALAECIDSVLKRASFAPAKNEVLVKFALLYHVHKRR